MRKDGCGPWGSESKIWVSFPCCWERVSFLGAGKCLFKNLVLFFFKACFYAVKGKKKGSMEDCDLLLSCIGIGR